MIIAGYQGIGKTTYASMTNKLRVLDLDSSAYAKENLWQMKYVDDIIKADKEYDIVLISTHPVVVNELARRSYSLIIVTPNHQSGIKHTEILLDRYLETRLEKDYHAWKGAAEDYTKQVARIIRVGYINAIPYELPIGKYLADEIVNIINIYNKYMLKTEAPKPKVKNIYLAGPLFTEAEVVERRYEANKLRELGYTVYNPIEQNDEIGFDLDELYRRDLQAMEQCDFAVVRLDNFDSGTMAELGWFVAKGKKVYSVWSNWKYEDPNNLFVRGMAVNHNNIMFNSIDALLEKLKEEVEYEKN